MGASPLIRFPHIVIEAENPTHHCALFMIDRSVEPFSKKATFHYDIKREAKMRYLHTMVRVNDLEKSIDFYCKIFGLKETRRTENESGRFTLVYLAAPQDIKSAEETHAPELELTYNWDTEDYTGGRNFGHLAYEVDNIYETCQKLVDQGIVINRPPRDGHMAFIKSPDGISIELLQKGEKLEPKEPWLSMKNTGTW